MLAAVTCGRGSPAPVIAREFQPAIETAIDSFPTLGIDREPLGAETATRAGDTVIVTLVARRALSDAGKWDGPRLRVWIVDDHRIVRSALKPID